jgi:hypothetical protein
MPLSVLGIHLLQPVRNDWLKGLQPQVAVVVGTAEHGDAITRNRAYASSLRDMLPNTLIGMRWWPDDKQSSPGSPNYRTPAQYAADYFKLHVRGTLLMPDNEAASSMFEPRVIGEVVNWWVRVVVLATNANIPLGIGCFPTGNPDYSQYHMLAPLFRAMRDAARLGVVHWWRPNAYYVPSDNGRREHHIDRHIREGKRVCSNIGVPFPPAFLGEYAPLKGYDLPEAGYARDWSGERLAESMIAERPTGVPAAVYCAGVGVYDERWRDFDVRDNAAWWSTMIRQCPRVPDKNNAVLTESYLQAAKGSNVTMPSHNWGALVPNAIVSLNTPINIRKSPTTASEDIGDLRNGDRVGYYPNPQQAAGYRWYRIVQDNGEAGYVADIQNLRFTVPAVPTVPLTGLRLTPEQHSEAKQLLERLHTILMAAQELV